MNIGEFIKHKRLENNLTLEQLGKRVGVSKMTVLRWENGEIKNIKSDKIEKLANALGIPVIALFDGFDTNGNKIKSKEITSKEFANQVRTLLSQTNDLSEQRKQHLLNTLEFICSDKE